MPHTSNAKARHTTAKPFDVLIRPRQRSLTAILPHVGNRSVFVPSRPVVNRGQFLLTIGTGSGQFGMNKSAGYGSIVQPTGFPEIIQLAHQSNGVLLLQFVDNQVNDEPLRFTDSALDAALGFQRTATFVEQVGQDRYRAAQPTSERFDAWGAALGSTINCNLINASTDGIRLIDRLYTSNTAADVRMTLDVTNSFLNTISDVLEPTTNSNRYREYYHVAESVGALHESFFSNVSGLVPNLISDTAFDTWQSMGVQKGLSIASPTVGQSVNEVSIRLASNQKVIVNRALVVLERLV